MSYDGAKAPKVLRITEVSPRPSGGSPEWIEVQNYNGFALSLKGWSFERSGTEGSSDYLYKDGVVLAEDLCYSVATLHLKSEVMLA